MLWSISETENIATKIIKLLYENNCTDEGDMETTFTLVRNHFNNMSIDDIIKFETTGKMPEIDVHGNLTQIIKQVSSQIADEFLEEHGIK